MTVSCHITDDNFRDTAIKSNLVCIIINLQKIKHMTAAYKNMIATERMTRDCLISGSSTTSLTGDASKQKEGMLLHTPHSLQNLSQITESAKSLHLFRTD